MNVFNSVDSGQQDWDYSSAEESLPNVDRLSRSIEEGKKSQSRSNIGKKSSGIDSISAVTLKSAGNTVTWFIMEHIHELFKKEGYPDLWAHSVIVLTNEKGTLTCQPVTEVPQY